MRTQLKFKKSGAPNPPDSILLNRFLYAYLIGIIKAPNEWTTVARFFNFPHYFSGRRTSPALIEGITEEIFYHFPKDTPEMGYKFWEITRDISEWLSDEQQESFKNYLINRPLSLEEEQEIL